MMKTLERRGLIKTPATLLREARDVQRNLPDFRVSDEAPDPECARITVELHDQAIREEQEEHDRKARVAAEEAQRIARARDEAYWEEQRRIGEERRRLQEAQRIVKDRKGKAVILMSAEELAEQAAREAAAEAQRRAERDRTFMGASGVMYRNATMVAFHPGYPYGY